RRPGRGGGRRANASKTLGERSMRHSRYILAGSALALILAVPFVSLAEDPQQLAAAPPTALPPAAGPATEAPATQATPAPAVPAVEPPALSGAPADATPAPEPAAAPARVVVVDPTTEKLRDLLATKAERFFTDKKERAAALAFYQARDNAPLWLDQGVANARAAAVIARIKDAAADGLEPGDY